MKTHRGIFYFQDYGTALTYARTHDYPTDRIIYYELGWAIQLRISGPYVGPEVRYSVSFTLSGEPQLYVADSTGRKYWTDYDAAERVARRVKGSLIQEPK